MTLAIVVIVTMTTVVMVTIIPMSFLLVSLLHLAFRRPKAFSTTIRNRDKVKLNVFAGVTKQCCEQRVSSETCLRGRMNLQL